MPDTHPCWLCSRAARSFTCFYAEATRDQSPPWRYRGRLICTLCARRTLNRFIPQHQLIPRSVRVFLIEHQVDQRRVPRVSWSTLSTYDIRSYPFVYWEWTLPIWRRNTAGRLSVPDIGIRIHPESEVDIISLISDSDQNPWPDISDSQPN